VSCINALQRAHRHHTSNWKAGLFKTWLYHPTLGRNISAMVVPLLFRKPFGIQGADGSVAADDVLSMAHRSWKTDGLGFFSAASASCPLLPACVSGNSECPGRQCQRGCCSACGVRGLSEEGRHTDCRGKAPPECRAGCKPCRGLGRGRGRALPLRGCRALGLHR